MKKRLSYLLLIGTCLVPFEAMAQSGQTLKLNADLRYQYESEHNFDLTTGGDSGDHTHALDGRVRAIWMPAPDITFLLEGRGYRNFSDTVSTEDEETGASNTNAFLELRQLWGRIDEPVGLTNCSLQIGRQRVSEPFNLWWNRDLDMVRLTVDYTLLKGFVGFGQEQALYRTGSEDFSETDQDRLRFFGELSHQWTADQYIEGRFLHENDHSGLEDVGAVLNTRDRDDEDARLTWIGLRAHGQVGVALDSPFHYRVDLMGVSGYVDEVITTAGPASDQRTVTAHDEVDVQAYALDMEGVFETTLPGRPSFLLGYAFGSGDDDTSDGDDNSFRQSGLHGNSNRAGGISPLRYEYGDVLNPDLSNLHIFTAGLILPTFSFSQTYLGYHYYRLVEEDGSIRGDQMDASLDGVESDLGHAVDLVVDIHLGQELDLTGPMAGSSVRLMGGAFRAGEAYVDSAEGETALRGFVEFRLTF